MSNIISTNSVRKIEKRTYTPVVAPITDRNNGDALGLARLIGTLEIQPGELMQLQNSALGKAGKDAVSAIQTMLGAVSGPQALNAVSQLAAMNPAAMQEVGQALGALRTNTLATLNTQVEAMHTQYVYASAEASQSVAPLTTAVQPTLPPPPLPHPPVRPSYVQEAKAEVVVHGATEPFPPNIAIAPVASNGGTSKAVATPPVIRTTAPMIAAPLLARTLGGTVAASLSHSLAWAETNHPAAFHAFTTSVSAHATGPVSSPSGVMTALSEMNRSVLLTELFLDGLTRRPLQPVGLLHLERLEMSPQDVERGELLYSLPLAPNEKVTLAHQEWTTSEQEFTDFTEDSLENFSQKGVTESTDMAASTGTQTQHTNALSMSQSPTATNAVTITPPASTTSAGSTVDDTTSKEESRSDSRQATSLASARTIKDHKVSFTVTTVSGVSDFTARVLENKSQDHSMRVDYFRRMRKWHNGLYRYGVRMTYDVVLPDPGAKLRARVAELQAIDTTLSTSFTFDLPASSIQVWNWESLADQYGAVLPAPPDQNRTVQVEFTVNYDKPQADPVTHITRWIHEDPITVAIPDGYVATSIHGEVNVNTWDPPNSWVDIYAGGQRTATNGSATSVWLNDTFDFGLSGLPTSGSIIFLCVSQNLQAGRFIITANFAPTDALMQGWRQRCWAILHDAAYTDFIQQRTQLRDRRAALQQQVGGDDALTLRRHEREEIMRLVLSWLFPGFDDANSVLNNLPNPGNLDFTSWQQVMEYGEYIKFVQTAIDWDNVMVFLYPYFWDTYPDQAVKLFLDHPDSLHREFLRAGAARVVLAIQPGFEEQVVSLLDEGNLGSLSDGNRFQSVVSDVQAANAAYALSTQNNPDGDDPAIPGVLIGSWTEYTPSSALDIDVVMRAVTTV
jgi:hypothetical protein